jgi:hypothetical protein
MEARLIDHFMTAGLNDPIHRMMIIGVLMANLRSDNHQSRRPATKRG